MPENKHFIQVILPLHLEWEPWYYTPCALEIGQRVKVRMGPRTYVAVVSAKADLPGVDPAKIRPILGVETALENILPSEIQFWRFIAEYYLCTVGDVYKMVYPAAKIAAESKKSLKKLSVRTASDAVPTLGFQDLSKPLLLNGWRRESEYEKHIQSVLHSGKDVLLIRPRAAQESFPTQRELAKLLRSDTPVLVEGSKACLFLPFRKLGLVIVDDEHSPLYKHNQAPRYNGRDAAVMLAGIHGAEIILGSGTPSLESLYNVRQGKYRIQTLPPVESVTAEIVDTSKELRKNGMVGERSRILLAAIEQVPKTKYLEINSWELPKALGTKIEKYSLVAVMGAEYLLSRSDFRADEKARQLFEELAHRCRGRLIIQTKDASHPVFKGGDLVEEWLSERRDFNLPPYSRMVEIRKPDMSQEVVAQHFLKRGAGLKRSKEDIFRTTEKNLIVDVDPL